MIENVIGVFGLPLGIAPNFRVNERDYLVPMVVEEPSIVAAVSSAAAIARQGGGFTVKLEESLLIGQVQVTGIRDMDAAHSNLQKGGSEILATANAVHPNLAKRGGGVRSIEIHAYAGSADTSVLAVHLLVDTCDAMGANLVNTICEAVGPQIAKIADGKLGLRILSNLADRALVEAACRVPLSALHTDAAQAAILRDGIIAANDFALHNKYRAVTHNKGIMNGIDALAIATGNDWRALEAGAHAFASGSDGYRALTQWHKNAEGDLEGELRIPLKPGIVGGSLQTNPGARLGLSLCGVKSADELAMLMGATGLAQNFAALKALSTIGIQKGHMALHARSVVSAAGIPEEHHHVVIAKMIESGDVKIWKAQQLSSEIEKMSVSAPANTRNGAATGTAAGKIILLGEHAVVYGRPALAVPVPAAVRANVIPGNGGIRLSAPVWGIDKAWEHGSSGAEGAAAVVDLIITRCQLEESSLDLKIDSSIPLGVGLGSSAAFAVAVIRALDRFALLELSDEEINTLALECEAITHGTPSGIDNYLSTYARPVLFASEAPRSFEHIDAATRLPLVVASCDQRGATKEMVAAVRRRHNASPAAYDAIFEQMGRLAVTGAEALSGANYPALGAMMNMCHGLLSAIEVSTPDLENMIHLARTSGAVGAKLTGAGGGGSIVALCPGRVEEVTRTLLEAGYQTMDLNG